MAIDAPYISSFLAQRTEGPVVLVGHSYGGFVISNVLAENVKALVFVDASIPDEGEHRASRSSACSGSAFDILGCPERRVRRWAGLPGRAARATPRRS